jgi:hypothetical protein
MEESFPAFRVQAKHPVSSWKIRILAQSLVDFNFQIPANAALFYLLTTIAAGRTFCQQAEATPCPPRGRAGFLSGVD